MRIISNFKDYYDFLIGKYGIDEKVVYNRVCSTEDDNSKNWVKSGIYKPKHQLENTIYSFEMLAVCGTIYCCHYYNGKHYFGTEAKDYIPAIIKGSSFYDRETDNSYYLNALSKNHLRKTDFNEKENCPVLVLDRNLEYAQVKNPKLSDFDFGKMLSAEECYLQINNFLSREKPVIDKRSDIQKIVGKGFDKKTSFRNVK